MSHAFIKEKDGMSLDDVFPSVTALIVYLTQENNGIRVYEKRKIKDVEKNREVYVMSNGLSYSKDELGKWYVI